MNLLLPDSIAAQVDAGRRSSNLAATLRLLPRERRDDALEFYDFCRIVDDLADAPELEVESRRQYLSAWRSALCGEPGAARIPDRLQRVFDRYGIDRSLPVAIVDGVAMDLSQVRFASFDDLRDYCWKVASAVGLVSIRIFGVPSPLGTQYAEALGVALQLTNIIRDVGVDAANGRIYLPTEDLRAFGVADDGIFSRRTSPDYVRMMEFQTARARGYYTRAAALKPLGCGDALRPAELMARVYLALLRKIERRRFPISGPAVRLSTWEKAWILIRAGSASRDSGSDPDRHPD